MYYIFDCHKKSVPYVVKTQRLYIVSVLCNGYIYYIQSLEIGYVMVFLSYICCFDNNIFNINK